MKKMGKKIWILVVFSAFIAIAMSFVSWLIYAVFADNYRDIKQQYYAVVSRQIVEDIENSVKNGKSIDNFYGMDKVLNNMLNIISTDNVPLNSAILSTDGKMLYNSFGTSDKKAEYEAMLRGDNVTANLLFVDSDDTAYTVAHQDGYEIMFSPIYDKNSQQIGVMLVFYYSADIENDLTAQKESSDVATLLCAGIVILVMVIYFICIPRRMTEDTNDEDKVKQYAHKSRQNTLMFIVPTLMIMAGLLAQCVMSYNEYQKRYRDVMIEGATGISEYLGEVIGGLNEKGIPYERMNGLGEYLATKVDESPLLWNVSIEKKLADTSSILNRDSEYYVSLPIGNEALGTEDMYINIEISQQYINEKMTTILLVFVVALAVAILMIFEILKLPDCLFSRLSKDYKASFETQADSVAPAIRLCAFIAFTGLYISTPFSAVLINQWNMSIFNIPVTVLASIPMTSELLATMLCSLFMLPLYKRLNPKIVLSGSAVISVIAQFLCFTAVNPLQLIIYRFVSGIGFAGIKYSLNTIVSLGSLTADNTTDNLAALNAGLLGGITCGASLGAIIASAISISTSYFIAGIFMCVFLLLTLILSPWKLIRHSGTKQPITKENAKKSKGSLSSIFSFEFIRYMLLVAVPLNIGLMFVVAFFPSFVASLGLPDVAVSYGYLINGLVGIYIGPKLLKALSHKIGRMACVFIALLIAAGSILVLNINIPLVIVMVSVALLGLFDGFGTPACSDYYVNLNFSKKIGTNQALSVLNVVGSVVQTVSPVLYSVILDNGTLGMNVLGFGFAACAVMFIITCKIGSQEINNKKKAKR